jgi:hypothetical protein
MMETESGAILSFEREINKRCWVLRGSRREKFGDEMNAMERIGCHDCLSCKTNQQRKPGKGVLATLVQNGGDRDCRR